MRCSCRCNKCFKCSLGNSFSFNKIAFIVSILDLIDGRYRNGFIVKVDTDSMAGDTGHIGEFFSII